MAEVDFSDRNSSEAWFKTQSGEVRCAMASRAALRVFAFIGISNPDDRHLSWTSNLRNILMAAVRANASSTGLNFHEASLDANRASLRSMGTAHSSAEPYDSSAKRASASARSSALSVDHGNEAARAIRMARGAVYYSTAFREKAKTGSTIADVQAASSAASQTVLTAASWDSQHLDRLLLVPVWEGASIPERIAVNHSSVLKKLKADPAWDFWVRFYEGMWEGTFTDWDLAFEVIKIDEADWEKGYEHIGEVIAGIEVRMRTAVATPLVRNSNDDLFHLSAEPTLDAELLDFVRQRIGLALRAALEANKSNGFNESCYEAITIRLAMESTNPSAVAGLLYDASLSFQKSIGDLYPEDGSLVALRGAAFAGSEEICEGDELARARCLRLAKLALNPNAGDIPDDLEEFAAEIAKEGDKEVAAILRKDAALLAKIRNAPRFVRARFTNYSATIVQWIDKAKKGEGRVTWLVKTLSKILDWWQNEPPAG